MKQEDVNNLLNFAEKRMRDPNNTTAECCFTSYRTLKSLISERERLISRLEISDDHNIDGITSRNATIRLLEMDKEKLTSKYEALELLIIDLNKKRVELSE